MKLVEINVMEAMEFIAKGREVDGLYYMCYTNSDMCYTNSDILCYNKYEVSSKDLHKLKWFLLEENDGRA